MGSIQSNIQTEQEQQDKNVQTQQQTQQNTSTLVNNEYKKIHIQKLKKSEKTRYKYERDYTKSLSDDYNSKFNVLYKESNGPEITQVSCNGFFDAFCKAYNLHGDVKISPDDVWIVIMIYFKEYVNDNAEALRNKFVSHQGKKKLTVITQEKDESKWDEFFEKIIIEIKNNTNGDIVDKLNSDFTTSGRFEKIISTSAIMDTFKSYFEYGRLIPMCGIQNIWMKGTLDDWIQLKTKLQFLSEYDIDNKLKKYILELNPILDCFIDTYQNKVDINYWNRIMDFYSTSLGSGSTTYMYGWILNFFGIYGEIEGTPDLKKINVDVEIDNRITSTIKKVKLVAGFVGVKEDESLIFSPQLAIAIIEK
jgi:hypothetical protein